MKIVKQLALLLCVAGIFILFNASVFFGVTKRCLPSSSENRSSKTIDVSMYLPFDEESKIYKTDCDLDLEGELPVIDGAEGLYPVFSAFVHAVYPKEAVVFDGQDFSPESKLQMNNTLRAYKAVVDGTSDIILCAGPSKEQLQYAEEKNIDLEFVPIGREAFVFLVSAQNPVSDLSARQIRDIYSGKYTNWNELGGKNIPINPMQRIAGSGSQTAFLSFMGETETQSNPLAFFGSPLGFSFRYYVEDVVNAGNIKLLSVNGVKPDREHISDGSYPIVFDFYAVYDKNNDNPNVKKMVDWMLSEEGQKIISETGYAPIR